jgi:pimeloyl-ACP methyl ester carboxylesterase
MANIPEQTVLVDGLRIHCRRAGEGPLLVLLHGWPQTGYCWRQSMAPFPCHSSKRTASRLSPGSTTVRGCRGLAGGRRPDRTWRR